MEKAQQKPKSRMLWQESFQLFGMKASCQLSMSQIPPWPQQPANNSKKANERKARRCKNINCKRLFIIGYHCIAWVSLFDNSLIYQVDTITIDSGLTFTQKGSTVNKLIHLNLKIKKHLNVEQALIKGVYHQCLTDFRILSLYPSKHFPK